MTNQVVEYNMNKEIEALFNEGILKVGASLIEVKEVKNCVNDGESYFAISLYNEYKASTSLFNISILYFEKQHKEEYERNLEILSQEKDIKAIAKDIIPLLSKEAVKKEKELCKANDGHTRKFIEYPASCIASIILPILYKEIEEMKELTN